MRRVGGLSLQKEETSCAVGSLALTGPVDRQTKSETHAGPGVTLGMVAKSRVNAISGVVMQAGERWL